MAKAAKLTILYGEGDAEAQSAPAAAFESAGYTVEKALGRKEVVAALERRGFDLVVLGPSLSRNDRHHLPYSRAMEGRQADRCGALASLLF